MSILTPPTKATIRNLSFSLKRPALGWRFGGRSTRGTFGSVRALRRPRSGPKIRPEGSFRPPATARRDVRVLSQPFIIHHLSIAEPPMLRLVLFLLLQSASSWTTTHMTAPLQKHIVKHFDWHRQWFAVAEAMQNASMQLCAPMQQRACVRAGGVSSMLGVIVIGRGAQKTAEPWEHSQITARLTVACSWGKISS